MGDHIVRRGPPTRPPQPRERRPTAEIPEQQLLELIRNPTDDDLEAELVLVESFPNVLPDATPDSLPSMGSARYAHTLRRGMQATALPTRRTPPPPPGAKPRPDRRSASSATAMPRMPVRSTAGAQPIGRVALGTPPAPSPVLTPAQSTPRLARSSGAIPPVRAARPVEPVAGPAIAPPSAAPRATTMTPPPPVVVSPVEPKVIVAMPELSISAEPPTRPIAPAARRSHLVLPVGLLLLGFATLALVLL